MSSATTSDLDDMLEWVQSYMARLAAETGPKSKRLKLLLAGFDPDAYSDEATAAEEMFATAVEDTLRAGMPAETLKSSPLGRTYKSLGGLIREIYDAASAPNSPIGSSKEVRDAMETMFAAGHGDTRKVMEAKDAIYRPPIPEVPPSAFERLTNEAQFEAEKWKAEETKRLTAEIAAEKDPNKQVDLQEALQKITDYTVPTVKDLRTKFMAGESFDFPFTLDRKKPNTAWTPEDISQLQLRIDNEARAAGASPSEFAEKYAIHHRGTPTSAANLAYVSPVESVTETDIVQSWMQHLARADASRKNVTDKMLTAVERGLSFFLVGSDELRAQGNISESLRGKLDIGMRALQPAIRANVLAGTRHTGEGMGAVARLGTEDIVYGGAESKIFDLIAGERDIKYRDGTHVPSADGFDRMSAVQQTADRAWNRLPAKMREACKAAFDHINGGGMLDTLDAVAGAGTKKLVDSALTRMYGSEKRHGSFLFLGHALEAAGHANTLAQADTIEVALRALQALEVGTGRRTAASTRSQTMAKNVVNAFTGPQATIRTDNIEAARKTILTLIEAHGDATRTIDIWRDAGVTLSSKDARLFSRWVDGMAVPAEDIPRMREISDKFGIGADFGYTTSLIGELPGELAGYGRAVYAPAAARSKLKSLIRQAREATQVSHETVKDAYQLAMKSVASGRTSGILLSSSWHAHQNSIGDTVALVVQGVPVGTAARSYLRLLPSNFLMMPPNTSMTGLLSPPAVALLDRIMQVFGTEPGKATQAVRQAARRTGDVMAHVFKSVFAKGISDIRTQDVLDGRPDVSVMIRGRPYVCSDLLQVFIQEGGLAGWDRAQLAHYLSTGELPRIAKEGMKVLQVNRRAAEAWADTQRIGAAITLMESGADPRTAIRVVVDTMFDYAESATALESSALWKAIQPYWIWTKNAQRRTIRAMADPETAWRLSASRKFLTRGTQSVSDWIYAVNTDPYGIREDRMSEEERAAWWAIRRAVEWGHDKDIREWTDAEKEQFVNNLADDPDIGGYDSNTTSFEEAWARLTPEGQMISQWGYGGPDKVPSEVVEAMKLIGSGRELTEYGIEGGEALALSVTSDLPTVFSGRGSYPESDPALLSSFGREKPNIQIPFGFTRDPRNRTPELDAIMDQLPDDAVLSVFILGEDNHSGAIRAGAGLFGAGLMASAGAVMFGVNNIVETGQNVGGKITGAPVPEHARGPLTRNFTDPRRVIAMTEDAFRPDEMMVVSDALQLLSAGDIESDPVYVHPAFASIYYSLVQYGLISADNDLMLQKYGELRSPPTVEDPEGFVVTAPRYVIHDPLAKLLFSAAFGTANSNFRSVMPDEPKTLAVRRDADSDIGTLPPGSPEAAMALLSKLAETGILKVSESSPQRSAVRDDTRFQQQTRKPQFNQ